MRKTLFSLVVVVCAAGNLSARAAGSDELYAYNAKGKRNPFIPLVTPDGQLRKVERSVGRGELLVEGIVYDKYGYSYAIVDGLVVSVGSVVGGFQVVRIEPERVIFSKDGQLTQIDLKKKEE